MSFKEGVIKEIEDSNKVNGENGHPALSQKGLGDDIVALFFGLVRNKSDEKLKEEIHKILESKNDEEIKNLFLLAFQTRWCRGGKGEKKLFYIIFSELLDSYPDICYNLLELIPHYGSWKDLRALYHYHQDPILFSKICDVLEKQLKLDIQELEKITNDYIPKISLLAKYYGPKKCFISVKHRNDIRKEISTKSTIDNSFFFELAHRFYNPRRLTARVSFNYAKMSMRKKIVELRKLLDIPEVKMCANKWAEINFSKVASLCISRNSRAFLDEDKKGVILHPDNEDRQICRKNIIEASTKMLKGGLLEPNELVEKILDNRISGGLASIINSQWDSLVKNIESQIKSRISQINSGNSNFDLSKCVVMSDVSGSMSGTPMNVSIGFGILISQLANDAFKDLVLTFDTLPEFHNLSKCKTFVEKVESLKKAKWGGSTNFEGAMIAIRNIVVNNKLKEDDIPQCLLVISDMQFDVASDKTEYGSYKRGIGWGTAYDNIKNLWEKLGNKMFGHPIEPPQIVFWNVRADTIGFPAAADEPGVTLMSGYSPSLLKFIFSGELQENIEIVTESGELKSVRTKLSPKETLAKILGDDGLNPVREVLHNLKTFL